jgi:hypothetical protein
MERPNTAKSLSPSVLVAGVVLDILTNQPIPDVAVYQRSNGESVGVYTDAAGVYVLQVDPGEPLRLSHVSYEPETLSVPADGGEVVHYLVPAAYDLGEGAEVFGDGPTPGPGPEPASAGVPWAVLLVLFGVGYVATRRRPLFRRNG